MSIVRRYGTTQNIFALTGDRLVAIEVVRQNVYQRPLFALASWRIVGAATAPQVDGVARVLVYKGAIANENDVNWNLTVIRQWEDVDSGLEVLADEFVPYRTPVTIDCRALEASERTKAEPGRALGALVLMPCGSDNVLIPTGQAVLTFHGEDVPDDSEKDVRSLKAK